MNDKNENYSESGPMERTAAEWYVLLDAEQPNSPTESEFATWLESNPESEASFERCEAAVKLLRILESDPDMRWVFKDAAETASGESARRREPQPAWPHNPRLAWGIAGVSVMVAAAAVLYRATPVESGGDAIAESQAPAPFSLVLDAAHTEPVVILPGEIVVDANALGQESQEPAPIPAGVTTSSQEAQVAQDQAEEMRSLVEEYRAVMEKVEAIIFYNTLLERQIADQEEVLQDRARDNAKDAEETRRIQEFERAQDNQRRLLNEARADMAREEARASRLETTFEENESLIVDVTE